MTIFACHMTKEGKGVACAGYIAMQGAHNLHLRLARQSFCVDTSGLALFPTYRRMAIANGVKASNPVLRPCRDDGQIVVADKIEILEADVSETEQDKPNGPARRNAA